ncbi:efflux RND transporter periplasmic adaptor subunit [Arsenicibacter rosenii]|uniref:Efflux transporter periplasmic adaptor subunit n=1 Tax=Arsenicibacter rosenii TaxID=1750698 RepID=A0A1S2VRE1_9BACT|nr:efflux RND transporter periplasmic adaptor subunit [Arsenicibacter rosenii]OIN60378.1 efflux transporter periplasmic adaptor subunit [Arsenicibacter rosenii]
MQLTRPIPFLWAIVLTGLFAACSSREQAPGQATPETTPESLKQTVRISDEQFQQTGIVLGHPDTLMMGRTIQATGKLEAPPEHWATVSAPMGGFVRATRLLEGDRVRKGQVLAVLEHPDYIKLQQEYLQAQARLHFVGQELDRQTELNREQVGARRNLEQSTADVQTTKALLASLEAQLEQLHISLPELHRGHIQRTIPLPAPIGGYVDKVNLKIGQFVNSTDVLVEIVNKEHLHLELQVFEQDVPQVREGQTVRFMIPQQQTGELTARVYRVGQTFDLQTKTVTVHANLVNADMRRLFPGSYIRATILTDQRRVLALPDDAVVQESNGAYVYVEEPGKGGRRFRLVAIKTGIRENGRIEVILPASFPASARIVRSGAYFLSAERAKEA